jgi:UDPglucose 6-dehydrogenase
MLIGVLGCGVVGEAVASNLANKHTVRRKDIEKYKGNDYLNDCDLIFVCVHDTGDGNNLRSALSELGPTEALIVIKTTVKPGTTDSLGAIYNPEFMCDNTAYDDFAQQPFAVIGGHSPRDLAKVKFVLTPFVQGPIFEMEPVQAEIVKLATNAFFATKVVFANTIADICENYGVDYRPIRDALYANPMIGNNHLDIWHKGYRGFGGKCLPKDLNILIDSVENQDIDTEILESVRDSEYNNWNS